MYFAWICERAIADREKYAPENWVELLYPSSKIQELIETARETGVDTSGFEARLAKLASA